MATDDRREKRKKEREEKRKAARRIKEKRVQRGKAAEYSWLAGRAFEGKDYRGALDWALKGLRMDPGDRSLMNLALSCAQILRDDPTLYTLLRQ